MDAIANLVWILGTLILLSVLTQGVLVTVGSVRRLAHQRERQAQARQLFDLRIEAARRQRQQEQQQSLAWAGWRKFEVRWKRHENGRKDICSFYLAPHDGKAIPAFQPGQFLTFRLDIPGQTKPVIRCYSLSDAAKPDYFRVSIRRAPPPRDSSFPPGLSSTFFHDAIQEGSILDVKAPSGNFFLDPTRADPVVLIGGGVGITPVLAMLNAIIDSGSKRETWFFLGVRDGDDHPMKEHLETLAREHSHVHLHVCYSGAREGQDRQGIDYHHTDFVGVPLFKKLLPSNNYEWYFCGPPPMMDALERDLQAWGVPEDRIHFEKFGPGPKKHQAVPAAVAGDEAGIEVSFNRSGKKLEWTSAAGSLLQLARSHGIAIESGCEQGNCGTCQTAVRAGEVVYLDKPAYDCEKGTCLVCVCQPKAALELDA